MAIYTQYVSMYIHVHVHTRIYTWHCTKQEESTTVTSDHLTMQTLASDILRTACIEVYTSKLFTVYACSEPCSIIHYGHIPQVKVPSACE